jgi:simple sugar transport system substrate-binding protein
VAFDVNVENEAIPQIEQSDYLLGRWRWNRPSKTMAPSFTAGYVYVPGIAPLDRRDVAWQEVKEANPGIVEAAMFGTLDNPIANSNANQARRCCRPTRTSTWFFAPYDEFAKGVKIAVDEAGLNQDIDIYSADVSTADISAMREPGQRRGRRPSQPTPPWWARCRSGRWR